MCFMVDAQQGKYLVISLASEGNVALFSIPGIVDVHQSYEFRAQNKAYELVVFAPRPYAGVPFKLKVSVR